MNQAAKDIIRSFGDQYGPYAFGVVSLLVIWFVIVQPELQMNRIEYDEQKQIVSQMKAIADTMNHTASTMERISGRMGLAESRSQ